MIGRELYLLVVCSVSVVDGAGVGVVVVVGGGVVAAITQSFLIALITTLWKITKSLC